MAALLSACTDGARGRPAGPCVVHADDSSLIAQQRLLTRLLGCAAANQIELHLRSEPSRPTGWFRIEAGSRATAAVAVTGSDPSSVLAGTNWYLDHVTGISITWDGSRIELPERLPSPPRPIERTSAARWRVALNDTSSAYTNPFRTWPEWESLLDVLALHGVNAVNLTEGQEATYLDTFTRLGFTEEEVRRWLPLPPHLPWFLLGNLDGTSSTDPGPSRELIEQRARLGRRIADRVRELGMTPILPGYSGLVPPGFLARNPTSRVLPQEAWNGFTRPDWMDPAGPGFATVAATFYAAQAERFGTSPLARIDLLHEGGQLGGVDLGAAARAVATSLSEHRPGATWVALGWQGNPRREMLAALDPSSLLVLDGASDMAFAADRAQDWPGVPAAFGSILGYGGRTSLGGNLAAWPKRYAAARAGPRPAVGSVAYMPEAASGNPAAFDLFFEMPWESGRIELDAWFAAWATARYGDRQAATVGTALLRSVYSGPSAGLSQGADSLFTVRPALYIGETVSIAQPLHYDPARLVEALDGLLDLPAATRRSTAYRSDLADIARQVLADHSRSMLRGVASATRRRDISELSRWRDRWLEAMDLATEVAGTRRDHRLETWLDDLESWGRDDAERAALSVDARMLLTTWGGRPTADGGLSDYAGREWTGLLDTHYRQRWSTWFADVLNASAAGRFPPLRDWFAFDERWARSDPPRSSARGGDIVDIARRVRVLVARR